GAVEGGGLPEGAVAVTFDDGYRDNLTAAVPVLRRFGIPATFFLSGDGASFRGSFWWEVLDASMDALGLSEEAARELHRRFMRAPEEERGRLFAELPATEGPFPPRLSRDEIREIAADRLFEVAAHGWSHRALGEMTPEEQRRDIEENVRDLEATTGSSPVSFAYPFGGPYTAGTIGILRGAGIRAACTVAGHAVTAATDPMEIPRLQVGDWTGEELEERIERLLGRVPLPHTIER
ncbi:MAG TPA: polysaccharide deacetylase family protein, partial [Thermoanaerobaculia bacterium]